MQIETSTVSKHILILGLGNEILGDDGLGIKVVKELKHLKNLEGANVTFVEGLADNLTFVDIIRKKDFVIVIDSWVADQAEKRVHRIPMEILQQTKTNPSSHIFSLPSAFKLANKLFPEEIPKEIVILVGEIGEEIEFKEELSDQAKLLIPKLLGMAREAIHDFMARNSY